MRIKAPSLRSWLVGVAIAISVVVGGVGLLYLEDSQPAPSGKVIPVFVSPGSSLGGVVQRLAQYRVISAPLLFRLYLELHSESVIDAGVYYFRSGDGYSRALGTIAEGPSSDRLTVLPGMTIQEIASAISGLPGESPHATTFLDRVAKVGSFHSPYLGPSTSSLEGLLYPDTYFVDPLGTPGELIQGMLNRSGQVLERAGLAPAGVYHGLTAYQVLVVASIVEKEAKTLPDERRVARVILNRLAAKMPLQMDSTVRYASANFSSPLTRGQLDTPSAYNTYAHPGLPPTPIGAVGSQAVGAVLHPASGPWLYFVQLRGRSGESFFNTYSEQQRAIAAYGVG